MIAGLSIFPCVSFAYHRLLNILLNFSWGLAYNLLADKLLGTKVFPESVFDMRKSFFIFGSEGFLISLRVRTETSWYSTVTSTYLSCSSMLKDRSAYYENAQILSVFLLTRGELPARFHERISLIDLLQQAYIHQVWYGFPS